MSTKYHRTAVEFNFVTPVQAGIQFVRLAMTSWHATALDSCCDQRTPRSKRGNDGSTYIPARFIKNLASNGTGRPVAPLSAPDFQAVPAISRCAHL